MIPAPNHVHLANLAATGVCSEYYASAAHYQAVAKRILGALREGHFVLMTGDPPADPQALSAALRDAAGPGSSVITILCGTELRRKNLKRGFTTSAKPKTSSPIFVLEGFGRLSDEQIEDLRKGTPYSEPIQPPAVLLVQMDFLSRLERPALHFLRDQIATQLHFQEVSDDEAIAVLHSRLLSLQTRPIEARGFRYGVLAGVVASATILGISIGALTLYSGAGPAGRPPVTVTAEHVSLARKAPSISDPVHEVAVSEEKVSAGWKQAGPKLGPGSMLAAVPPSTLAPQPTTIADQTVKTLPAEAEPAAGSRLSVTNPSAVAEPVTGSGRSTDAPLAVSEPVAGSGLSAAASPAVSAGPVADSGPSAAFVAAPASSRPSATANSELLARGDAFLEVGDIASARLYYERAADAESGPAALRMGATFDTVFTRRAFLGAFTADPEKALFWYRRARELGVGEAEQRIKALQTPPAVEPHSRPSSK
jgi:hypothetical protein